MHWKPNWRRLVAASLGCRKAQDYWTKRWTRPDSLRSENSEAEELRIQTPEVKEHKCVPSLFFINMSASSAHYIACDSYLFIIIYLFILLVINVFEYDKPDWFFFLDDIFSWLSRRLLRFLFQVSSADILGFIRTKVGPREGWGCGPLPHKQLSLFLDFANFCRWLNGDQSWAASRTHPLYLWLILLPPSTPEDCALSPDSGSSLRLCTCFLRPAHQ